MSFGIPMGYGGGLGYGGGDRVLFFSQTQFSNSKTHSYMSMNVGHAPADMSETDSAYGYMSFNVEEVFNVTDWGGASVYMSQNVGGAVVPESETEDANQYMYQAVIDRPAGSGAENTPTLN